MHMMILCIIRITYNLDIPFNNLDIPFIDCLLCEMDLIVASYELYVTLWFSFFNPSPNDYRFYEINHNILR